ncbi:prolipoprotein diacylglyceryl transferase [Desulfothermus okinawensis JCM 13304]
MHPVLIKIGPITIYTYGFFIASAFLLALGYVSREARKQYLDTKMVSDVGFYIIISGILGARVLYVLMNLKYFLNHPLEALMVWKGGLVFSGGAILGVFTAVLYLKSKKQDIWQWADLFAPGIALGQFVGRFGCLMAGCCYGRYCTLPWAITFKNPDSLAPINIPLHPTQLYHSMAGLVTFFILCFVKNRVRGRGLLFGFFLILYGVFRFSIEFFRGDFRPMLSIFSYTQWGALLLAIMGALIVSFRWKKEN